MNISKQVPSTRRTTNVLCFTYSYSHSLACSHIIYENNGLSSSTFENLTMIFLQNNYRTHFVGKCLSNHDAFILNLNFVFRRSDVTLLWPNYTKSLKIPLLQVPFDVLYIIKLFFDIVELLDDPFLKRLIRLLSSYFTFSLNIFCCG